MGNPPLNLEQAIDALREFPQQLREKNDGKGVATGLVLWQCWIRYTFSRIRSACLANK